MPQRFELGETPHVEVVTCRGDLRVKGALLTQITASGEGIQLEIVAEDQAARIISPGDCDLRVPKGSRLHIGEVTGDLRLKGIEGATKIGTIVADGTLRSVGEVKIGRTAGSLHIRYANGQVALGHVGSDVALRGIVGAILAEAIGGDLYALDIEGGAEVGHIGGNLSVRTAFQAGARYRFAVGGDATFRTVPEVSVRFVVPADAALELDDDVTPVVEGKYAIITLGDGRAEVMIESMGGSLRITGGVSWKYGPEEDLDEHLASVAAEVDAGLEEMLNGVSFVDAEALRERAQRKMDKARRQAVSHQRNRRSVGIWGGDSSPRQDVATRRRGGRASQGWEPVSDEERLAILKMVEEGKISAEEAEMLLAALGGEEP